MFELTDAERDRRWALVRGEMEQRGLDCLIVQGSYACFRYANANLAWMTNTHNEGFLVFPHDDEPTLFTFEDGLEPTWVTDWRGAIPHFAKAMIPRLSELGAEKGKIGLVGLSGLFGEYGGFPHATWEKLTSAFADTQFTDATEIVDEAKKVKSEEEIHCLEIGCKVMKKVFGTIKETAGFGVEDWEVRGAIMETLWRNGCEPGSMLLYCQGQDVMHGGQTGGYLKPKNPQPLDMGDVILIELDATYLGYPAQFNHAWCVGEPDGEWQAIFDCAAKAYAEGLRVLKPGTTVGELEEAMLQPLKDDGFTWGNPPFHGLGLGLEAPMGNYPRVNYAGADPAEAIKQGMVFEFEPHPATSDLRRAASVGSPILVTDDGSKQLAEWWTPEAIIV